MTSPVILTSDMNLMVPIIKVVGNFCNLRCGYCFHHDKDQSGYTVMSESILEKFLCEYLELFSGHLSFIWHGGEPLLTGIPFFQKAVELQGRHRKDKQKIRNYIQTNATLIDDEWAEFFKKYGFRVGISLDGDKESHNRFRFDCAGIGSFDQTMRGLEILLRHGIKPGIIQTLTHSNTDRAKENFDFFANALGLKSWGINIYLDVRDENRAMAGQSVSSKRITVFLEKCIDLWLLQNDPDLKIREIDNFIAGVFGKRASSCNFNGSCTGYFCVDYDAKIYPCDRSSGSEFLLGDLKQQSLLEILNGEKRLSYAKRVNSSHHDCSECEWRNACHSGCPIQRIGGVEGKYYYCETRKSVFVYLKERLDSIKSC